MLVLTFFCVGAVFIVPLLYKYQRSLILFHFFAKKIILKDFFYKECIHGSGESAASCLLTPQRARPCAWRTLALHGLRLTTSLERKIFPHAKPQLVR